MKRLIAILSLGCLLLAVAYSPPTNAAPVHQYECVIPAIPAEFYPSPEVVEVSAQAKPACAYCHVGMHKYVSPGYSLSLPWDHGPKR